MDNSKLLETYINRLSKFKIVSFDIFDTLIHRAVHRPTDVFDVAAAKLQYNAFGLMNPKIACNFAIKRVEAETEARKRLVASDHTPEVGLEDIYDVLSEFLCLTKEQRSYLQNLELDLENRFCHPNPVMQALFPIAREDGRKVVLCTDMYLPSWFIENLLTKCGYDKPYTLLLS